MTHLLSRAGCAFTTSQCSFFRYEISLLNHISLFTFLSSKLSEHSKFGSSFACMLYAHPNCSGSATASFLVCPFDRVLMVLFLFSRRVSERRWPSRSNPPASNPNGCKSPAESPERIRHRHCPASAFVCIHRRTGSTHGAITKQLHCGYHRSHTDNAHTRTMRRDARLSNEVESNRSVSSHSFCVSACCSRCRCQCNKGCAHTQTVKMRAAAAVVWWLMASLLLTALVVCAAAGAAAADAVDLAPMLSDMFDKLAKYANAEIAGEVQAEHKQERRRDRRHRRRRC